MPKGLSQTEMADWTCSGRAGPRKAQGRALEERQCLCGSPRWGVKKELDWEATQGNGDSHTNKFRDNESLA